MRYVLEAITHNVWQSRSATMLVERVFVNAGSRQYSIVENDNVPGRFEGLSPYLRTDSRYRGWDPDKLMRKTIQRSLSNLK